MNILFVIDRIELKYFEFNNLVTNFWMIKSLLEKGYTFPHQHFFPLIKEIGIPVVVNADSHYPQDVDNGVFATYQLLQKAGFKNIYTYYNNQWTETEINI